jgi:hypothetical protein
VPDNRSVRHGVPDLQGLYFCSDIAVSFLCDCGELVRFSRFQSPNFTSVLENKHLPNNADKEGNNRHF